MTETLIEIILLIYTFNKSFLLGVFVLGYMYHTRDKYKGLEQQLKSHASEEKEEIEKPEVKGTPIRFYAQKAGYIVEEYKTSFFVMIRPNGKRMEKIFYNLEEAEKEIDIVVPFLEETTKKRGRR